MPTWAYGAIGLGMGSVIGLAIFFWPMEPQSPLPPQPAGHSTKAASTQFTLYHSGAGRNCVVDGDTLWIDGVKVRMSDIDAPETHPPRCKYEAELGDRATRRLRDLVNAGPFDVVSEDGRDTDRYGRRLRVLKRNGMSLGQQLVDEGLARRWEGRRRPWC
jgi:micrococcal nuclease